MNLALALSPLPFNACIYIRNRIWTRNPVRFLSIIEQNIDNSTKISMRSSFCAGPSLSGLGTVFSVWQSCVKPSTKFPHGGLVECLFIPYIYYPFLLKKIKKSYFFEIFSKILFFSKFLQRLGYHRSGRDIVFSKF